MAKAKRTSGKATDETASQSAAIVGFEAKLRAGPGRGVIQTSAQPIFPLTVIAVGVRCTFSSDSHRWG
jgi:hypothetical protein